MEKFLNELDVIASQTVLPIHITKWSDKVSTQRIDTMLIMLTTMFVLLPPLVRYRFNVMGLQFSH